MTNTSRPTEASLKLIVSRVNEHDVRSTLRIANTSNSLFQTDAPCRQVFHDHIAISEHSAQLPSKNVSNREVRMVRLTLSRRLTDDGDDEIVGRLHHGKVSRKLRHTVCPPKPERRAQLSKSESQSHRETEQEKSSVP